LELVQVQVRVRVRVQVWVWVRVQVWVQVRVWVEWGQGQGVLCLRVPDWSVQVPCPCFLAPSVVAQGHWICLKVH